MHPTEVTIHDYIDNALAPADRSTIDAHLEGCSECRALVVDLREIRRAAASLAPLEPRARAWTRIEEVIKKAPYAFLPEQSHAKRGTAPFWRRPALLATAALLVVATAVGLRFARTTPSPPASPRGDAAPSAQAIESELMLAEQHYQKAISGLEQIANAERGALDPQTAATLQKNLGIIDQAISESRAALKAQPNSEPAQQSLLENFKTKITVLQDTVALINEMRKGNEAGAARIVSGIKQKG